MYRKVITFVSELKTSALILLRFLKSVPNYIGLRYQSIPKTSIPIPIPIPEVSIPIPIPIPEKLKSSIPIPIPIPLGIDLSIPIPRYLT